MVFVQNALDRHGDTPHELWLFIAVERLMIKRNEADVIAREPVIEIISLVAVISERARKVFDYDTVYSAAPYVVKHPLKVRALIVRRSGYAVVNILVDYAVFVAVVH